ncbi:unnamed protein product [Peronospora belbahrii]|uniref:Uncharacterized protein n=1 Tax=Peronospora belbahrii TaxID=622444 RepID=A0AAU9LET2_9STRA|nr:unnamed protein product [Peronospora belbahrii]CAH0516008.1 unnamed protein product [Peronospora belbahrii]
MGLSVFFQRVWDLVRRPFEDCTSCCDVIDPDYYRKASPGVHRTPRMYDHWERDVKYFTQSRPPLSRSSSTSSRVGLTKRSTSSGSRSRSDTPSNCSYSYDKEEAGDRQVQFLFYGGSDYPTPAGGLCTSGYRSDMISHYVRPMMESMSPVLIKSPRINHEMPCFFSPRNAPQSPMFAPIYSPHLFTITEHRIRYGSRYYNVRFCR